MVLQMDAMPVLGGAIGIVIIFGVVVVVVVVVVLPCGFHPKKSRLEYGPPNV